MAHVELLNVSKRYGNTVAVNDVTIQISEGEFFSLLGPSGCGKTTTLRMVAGFVRPSTGTISIGGQDVTRLPPEKRDIGIVFQNYAIFPHMNVYDNIAFGLRMRKLDKAEIDKRVREALEQVGLRGYERRYQREMSGGEQQRVALARVLVTHPRILLLDEPLSALDKKLREEMKYWIKELQQQLRITTIYVTHDQGEALTMSDRMAVMSKGRVLQIGSPSEIYEHPNCRFVTEFIGESNVLPARVTRLNGEHVRLALDGFEVDAPLRPDLVVGQEAALAVRPENVLLGADAERPGVNRVRARVKSESYQGSLIRHELVVGPYVIVAESQNRPERPHYPPGTEVSVGWLPRSSAVLTD